MAAESSIVLITNDNNVTEHLRPKLVLLREIDNISSVTYAEAVENIKKDLPDTIILHCANEKEECLELIKQIKSEDSIKDIAILLVLSEYNQDFILSAYDENISDYMTLKNDDAEILMRTIWCLKKSSLVNSVKKQYKLLEDFSVIDKETGFYASKFSDRIFANELTTIEELEIEGILMVVSPTEESKTTLDPIFFAKAIKNSTRNSDVIAHGPLNKFYILLPKTPLKGAFCVWDKIKKAVGDDHPIIAGLGDVLGKNFETLKKELLAALIEAETTKNDLIVVNSEEETASGDWLEKINSTQKNFKLFKQAFNKKLDKVITPVFFQVQKLYEEKLFNTTIEQYSNSTLSSFALKSSKCESELKITYPGFSKINIDIIYQGLDTPENKRISLSLTELDDTRLTNILEDFVQEFKTTAKI